MFDSTKNGITELFQKLCDIDASSAADHQVTIDTVREIRRALFHSDLLLTAIVNHLGITQHDVDAAISNRPRTTARPLPDYSAVRRMNERAAAGRDPFDAA